MTPLVVDADVRAKSYTEAKKLQPSFPAPNNQTGDRPFSQPRALDFRPDTHQTSALGRCQNDVFLLANQGFLHALATCSSFQASFLGFFTLSYVHGEHLWSAFLALVHTFFSRMLIPITSSHPRCYLHGTNLKTGFDVVGMSASAEVVSGPGTTQSMEGFKFRL